MTIGSVRDLFREQLRFIKRKSLDTIFLILLSSEFLAHALLLSRLSRLCAIMASSAIEASLKHDAAQERLRAKNKKFRLRRNQV